MSGASWLFIRRYHFLTTLTIRMETTDLIFGVLNGTKLPMKLREG